MESREAFRPKAGLPRRSRTPWMGRATKPAASVASSPPQAD